MSDTPSPLLEVTAMVEEMGGDTVRMCYNCGTCSASCPHNQVSDFETRGLLRLIQLGLEGYERDALWRCTTCNLCVDRCPRGVEIVEVIAATRRLMTETGSVPDTLKAAMGSLASQGNPWNGAPEKRHDWAREIPLPLYEPSMEVLLFQCCTIGYDPRSTRVGRALLRLLTRAGVTFGVMAGEQCCGESARKTGRADLFESLRDANTRGLIESGARRVVTTSPHCHHALSSEYPGLAGGPEVVHVVSFLHELIRDGRLVPTRPVDERVTYHDPCYLGRHQGLYDPAREVLRAIPGLEVVEMRSSAEDGLCCGGGGGGMWMERTAEERLSIKRWEQADEVGATTMATACPYCVLMLEDGKTVLGRDETHDVLDVIELLDRSITE